MPIFVILAKAREPGGFQALLEHIADPAAQERTAQALGGKVLASVATTGDYHSVTVIDLPDPAAPFAITSSANERQIDVVMLPALDAAGVAQALEQTAAIPTPQLAIP